MGSGALLLTLLGLLGGSSYLKQVMDKQGDGLSAGGKRQVLELIKELEEKEQASTDEVQLENLADEIDLEEKSEEAPQQETSKRDEKQEVSTIAKKKSEKREDEPFVPCLKSRKKGVALATKDYLCDDFDLLENINWYYDWRLSLGILKEHTVNCPNIPAIEYTPMVWKHIEDEWIGYAYHNTDDYYILMYNEPMRYLQANMTPEHAAASWKKQRHQIGPKTKVILPSASACKEVNKKCMMDDFEWFDRFLAACDDCHFDYLAAHHYSCNAKFTLDFLKKLYTTYGYDIWLTEFACLSADVEEVITYMKEVLPHLERLPYVIRYAWFKMRITGEHEKGASLLEADSSALTEAGKLYNIF